MTDFDQRKLRRLDLTVLLIFLGLMRHRKAATVAADLGLTNSSISHALNRLRDVFEDALFLRRPHGLEPTAFAEAIEPSIRRAVENVETALAGPPEFDPQTTKAHIRLSTRDHEIATVLPPLIARATQAAPGLTVSIATEDQATSLARLKDGTTDIAVGYFADPGPSFSSKPLISEHYLVTACAGHALFSKDEVDLKTFCGAEHLLVSRNETMRGIVDDTLAELGFARRVRVSVPQFLAAFAILAETDLVATLPRTLVERHAKRFGLGFAEPPIAIRSFTVSTVTHRRDAANPAIQWVLDQIA